MDKRSEIGTRLKEFAEEKFPTITDFASAIGLKSSQVYLYFKGDSVLGGEKLSQLAEFGCDINWLLTGSKQPYEVAAVKDGSVQYVSIAEAEKINIKPFVEYPLLGTVPAGRYDYQDRSEWPDYNRIDYDPRSHFWLEIDREYGHSMAPFLIPGDTVLCSYLLRPLAGDIVAVRYDETKGAIKIIGDSRVKGTIALVSYNAAEMPIILSIKDVKQIYKVVLIKKKL